MNVTVKQAGSMPRDFFFFFLLNKESNKIIYTNSGCTNFTSWIMYSVTAWIHMIKFTPVKRTESSLSGKESTLRATLQFATGKQATCSATEVTWDQFKNLTNISQAIKMT